MNCVVLTCLLAMAAANPAYDDSFHHGSASSKHVPIIEDDRVHPDASGAYAFNFKTGDGVARSESGAPVYEAEGAVAQQGAVSFTFPNGEPFELKFVADQGGYQPQSPWLPVAPAFPHPIPEFVLAQIEKARLEDAQGQRYEASAPVPHNRYSAP